MFVLFTLFKLTLDERKTLTKVSTHKPLTTIPQTSANFGTRKPAKSILQEEDQQRVPKSTDDTKVKCSKQQPRQPDEHLCFYCNSPGHLQRNCPELPYCPRCRTRGHTPDRCTKKPQKNGRAHPTGKPRDQQKRRDNLPQSSGSHNKCLQCGGDHHTTSCMQ